MEELSSRNKIVCPFDGRSPPGGTELGSWLVINLPANVTSLEEGALGKKMPPGFVELKNSFGDIGY